MLRIFGRDGPMMSDRNVGIDWRRRAARSKAVKPFGAKERARAERRRASTATAMPIIAGVQES
jgi:hypothetical protein